MDIETFPNTAHVWQLWNIHNVGINQVLESGRVACFAAQWLGEKKIHFHSEFEDGREGMLQAAYDLFNEADVIVGWNSKRFDIPWLQGEWLRLGWTPPAPFNQVDLCEVAKSTFRMPSNKLDYFAGELLGKKKVKNVDGHELWIACMAMDPDAWKQMERYNRMDVKLTGELYERMKPWVRSLPNPALYGEANPVDQTCPQCGSGSLTKEGFSYTKISVFQRYSCDDCGRWCRGKSAIGRADLR